MAMLSCQDILAYVQSLPVVNVTVHKLQIKEDELDLPPLKRLSYGQGNKLTEEELKVRRREAVARSKARNPDTYKIWYQANKDSLNAKQRERRKTKVAAAKLEKLNGTHRD